MSHNKMLPRKFEQRGRQLPSLLTHRMPKRIPSVQKQEEGEEHVQPSRWCCLPSYTQHLGSRKRRRAGVVPMLLTTVFVFNVSAAVEATLAEGFIKDLRSNTERGPASDLRSNTVRGPASAVQH